MKDQSSLYKFLRSSSKSKLLSLIEELHNAYRIRTTYFLIIQSYKKEIIKAGIKYNELENLAYGKREIPFIISKDVKILDEDTVNYNLVATIKYFIYNCTTKLNQIERLIYIYQMVSTIPYAEMVKVSREYNKDMAAHMLKGNIVTMPYSIGNFGIRMVKRNHNKKAINFKESNLYKKYLIENGRRPKISPFDVDGEEWLIYFTDDYYIHWKWLKSSCKIPNNNWFSFKVNSFYRNTETNEDDINKKCDTLDKIINTNLVGNLQKSLMIARKFKDIKELYHHGL